MQWWFAGEAFGGKGRARGRAAALPHLLEQVRIPANAAGPARFAADEFHTIPRSMLQLLAEFDAGQLALPDFQRSFVWAPVLPPVGVGMILGDARRTCAAGRASAISRVRAASARL